MQSPEAVEVLRDQVKSARQQRDTLKGDWRAKDEEYARLSAMEVALDKWGRPVADHDSEKGTGVFKLKDVGSPADIKNAGDAARKAQAAYKDADLAYDALVGALAEAEKTELPLEVLEMEMAALVGQDASLFEQMEDQIYALRATMAAWNTHVEAKIALRRQFNERKERSPEAGAIGKADSRWSGWLTADFASDEALHRQFDLLAHGKGYLNPMPNRFLRAMESASAVHGGEDAKRRAAPVPSGYRRHPINI